jgi:hypothetical protein
LQVCTAMWEALRWIPIWKPRRVRMVQMERVLFSCNIASDDSVLNVLLKRPRKHRHRRTKALAGGIGSPIRV